MTSPTSAPADSPATAAAPSLARGARVTRNVIALGSSQVITWTCTTLLVVLLPRHLGDSNFGKLAIAIFLANLLSLLLDLGANSYLTKEISRRATPEEVASYTFNTALMRIPLCAIGLFISAAAINLLGYDESTKLVVYVSLPSIAVQSMVQLLSSSLMGLQDMRPIAWTGAFSRVVYSVIVAALVALDKGVVLIAAATNVSSILSLVILGYYVNRRIHFRWHLDPSLCKAIFVGGLPYLLWQASLVLYGQIDIFQLSLMTSDAVVGWYAAAYQIILVPGFIPFIAITALFPLLSSLAHKDKAAFAAIAQKSFGLVIVSIVPMSLGMAVLAPKVLAVFHYPGEFDKAIPLITILALHMPFAAASTVVGTCLNAVDRQNRWAFIGVAAAVFNPLINLAIIPFTVHAFHNGAIGAAIVTDLTELFMFVAGLRLLPPGILGRADFGHAFKCLSAGVVMVVAVWFVRDQNIVLSVTAGAAVYCLASLAFGTISIADGKELLRYLKHRNTEPSVLVSSSQPETAKA